MTDSQTQQSTEQNQLHEARRPNVFITGISRGIGTAVALRLAAEGFGIAGCCSRPSQPLEDLLCRLESYGTPHCIEPCDVRDAEALETLVRRAEQTIGPINTLVANAGITRDAPLALSTADDWRMVVDVNLGGSYHVCRLFAYRFMKRRSGVILTMSSVAGLDGNVGQTTYAATKAGVIGLAKSLAKELAPYGVRVNVVAPGFITTDMTEGLSERQRAKALDRIPLRRFGDSDDVADMVEFLASARASYITGQVLRVDGGMTL